MYSRLLKYGILLYLLKEQLVPLEEEKARYGANPFFVQKNYLTESGKKSPLNNALVTKMLRTIPANHHMDKKILDCHFYVNKCVWIIIINPCQ